MSNKRYAVARQNNRNLPSGPKRTNLPTLKMNGSLPNIFHNNPIKSEHALSKDRIHCVAVERTAIYQDAYGNKIILKENQETMNTPKGLNGSLRFSHGKRNWTKR